MKKIKNKQLVKELEELKIKNKFWYYLKFNKMNNLT